MRIGLTLEADENVYAKTRIVSRISEHLKNFFQNRTYGDSIKTFLIGVICLTDLPAPNELHPIRKKYNKAKRELSYDIKLDHKKILLGNLETIRWHLIEKIIESFTIIKEFELKNFDFDMFTQDLTKTLHSYEIPNSGDTKFWEFWNSAEFRGHNTN